MLIKCEVHGIFVECYLCCSSDGQEIVSITLLVLAAETVPPPNTQELFTGSALLKVSHVDFQVAEEPPEINTVVLLVVVVHNAIPFVGFGFLDNFCMILAVSTSTEFSQLAL